MIRAFALLLLAAVGATPGCGSQPEKPSQAESSPPAAAPAAPAAEPARDWAAPTGVPQHPPSPPFILQFVRPKAALPGELALELHVTRPMVNVRLLLELPEGVTVARGETDETLEAVAEGKLERRWRLRGVPTAERPVKLVLTGEDARGQFGARLERALTELPR